MNDEQAIRELTETWMQATKDGDSTKILSLMAEDVVFLVPGRPVMRKADFAAALSAQAGMTFEGTSDIQEIKVLGDWAYLWTRLKVVATPRGAKPVTREGYTLSILKKEKGRWLLARDANMLAPVASKS